MSEDKKVVDLDDHRLRRHFQKYGLEYDRIRPQFEAIKASTDPFCYFAELMRQAAMHASEQGIDFDAMVEHLRDEYDGAVPVEAARDH